MEREENTALAAMAVKQQSDCGWPNPDGEKRSVEYNALGFKPTVLGIELVARHGKRRTLFAFVKRILRSFRGLL